MQFLHNATQPPLSRGSKARTEVINEPSSPETLNAVHLPEGYSGEVGARACVYKCIYADETCLVI